MFDYIMTDAQKKLRDEARAFTKWVPKQLILDMDAEKIQFPREYLEEAGRRNLLGIRLSKELGGRGLTWVDDSIVAEEIGVASYSLACLWGVGADIVCEAVTLFGNDELKQAVEEWFEAEMKAIDDEEVFLKSVLRGRTGSERLAAANTASARVLVIDDLGSFLSG